MHERCGTLLDVGTPKSVVRRVTRAVEYVEGRERIYGSRCSRCKRRAGSGRLEERMNARVLGGPSAIAEDASCDVSGEEAGTERRAEGFPGHHTLVVCEAAEGIVPCWGIEKEGLGG